MNIAILSTAHIHTDSFLKNLAEATDGRRIHAIWDDVTDRGQGYADKYKAPFQPDLDAVLGDPAIDGFIICAENTRHLPLLKLAMPVGKPVFCEKPLTTTAADAAEVRALHAQYPVPLFCGYFMPFNGDHQAARQIMAGGLLGQVTRLRFRNAHHAAYGRWFDKPALNWFTQPALSGGGALMDMGTHALHMLIGLGGRVDSVWASVSNVSGIYPEVDDYGVAHLRLASGVLGQVEAAWTQTGGPLGGLEIVGSEGTLARTSEGLKIFRPGAKTEDVADADSRPDRVDRLIAIIRGEISQPELDAGLEACFHAAEVMSAAYQSAGCGEWVKCG